MLKKNLAGIKQRIQNAAHGCGRDPNDVKLVAVSKTVETERVQQAIEAGVTILGENYVQEARDKITTLSRYPVSWHFIGHLQSNKSKYVVRLFDLIHSVDRLKLAQELNKQARKLDKIQNILIQVNISGEAAKSGIAEAAAIDLVKEISALEHLSIQGLMTMPPYFNEPEKVKPYFAALQKQSDQIRNLNIANVNMHELSMGMTGDFEVAIENGATLIRIGTAIFGERL